MYCVLYNVLFCISYYTMIVCIHEDVNFVLITGNSLDLTGEVTRIVNETHKEIACVRIACVPEITAFRRQDTKRFVA